MRVVDYHLAIALRIGGQLRLVGGELGRVRELRVERERGRHDVYGNLGPVEHLVNRLVVLVELRRCQ